MPKIRSLIRPFGFAAGTPPYSLKQLTKWSSFTLHRMTRPNPYWFVGFCLCGLAAPLRSQPVPKALSTFLQNHCFECHDPDMKKAGLDLTALKFDPRLSDNFAKWVRIDDRVSAGEMPPKKKPRPELSALKGF